MAKGLRRELSAEFLATFVLMLFGLGVNAQVTLGAEQIELAGAALTDRPFGDFFSINVGWGIAVALAVFVGGGVSGAHLNPAVTIAMAVRGQFAWKKVAPFVAIQFVAAILASWLVYVTYREAIDEMEKERASAVTEAGDGVARTMATAGIYGTYPRKFSSGQRLSNWSGLIDQVVGTGLLLLCVCALGDSRNMAPKSNLAPFAIGAVVWMVGMSFGSNCGYAINPARDLGPRLFSWWAGWADAFGTPNASWWLIPVAGPILGGILGALVYEVFVFRQHDPESTEGAEA